MQRDRKAEARDERERMRGIDRERRQQRKDVVEEVILDPAALGLGDFPGVDHDDAVGAKRLAQLAPDFLLVAGEL